MRSSHSDVLGTGEIYRLYLYDFSIVLNIYANVLCFYVNKMIISSGINACLSMHIVLYLYGVV